MDLMQAFNNKYLKAEPPVAEVGDTVRAVSYTHLDRPEDLLTVKVKEKGLSDSTRSMA